MARSPLPVTPNIRTRPLHVVIAISEADACDVFASLPEELFLRIIVFSLRGHAAPARFLCSLCQINRRFHRMCSDNAFWRPIIQRSILANWSSPVKSPKQIYCEFENLKIKWAEKSSRARVLFGIDQNLGGLTPRLPIHSRVNFAGLENTPGPCTPMFSRPIAGLHSSSSTPVPLMVSFHTPPLTTVGAPKAKVTVTPSRTKVKPLNLLKRL